MTVRSDCDRCGTDTRHTVTGDNGEYLTAKCEVCGSEAQLPT